MKYFIIFLFFVVICIISVIVILNEHQIVTFNYLINKGDYSILTLLAALFTIGFTLGFLLTGVLYIKTLITLSYAIRKIRRLENQLVKVI
ncbi:MAG: lipopolysaccharide assembly protein LapA domain-containing protein [Arsenophonus sp.]|nr:MAG: lipopolysaccharide assembly protein LapA domain-containing protein [Arsenophonus sp.]